MKRFRVSIYGLIEDRPVKGVISAGGRAGWAAPARRKGPDKARPEPEAARFLVNPSPDLAADLYRKIKPPQERTSTEQLPRTFAGQTGALTARPLDPQP